MLLQGINLLLNEFVWLLKNRLCDKEPSEMKKSIYSSADFQVPQERKRVIIIGVNDKSEFKCRRFLC